MSLTVTVRKKRDAAKLRKFIKRQALVDDTSGGADLSVGNQAHIWLDLSSYMAWCSDSADNDDTHVTIRELYAEL